MAECKELSVFTNDVVNAIYQIALRSEQTNDTNGLLNSFYDDNLIKKLNNINNQTIRGRRGTGKTHILNVLSAKLEQTKEHAIYIDCRLLGSAGSISSDKLELSTRSMCLFRDFIYSVTQDLFDYYSWNKYSYDNDDDYRIIKNNLDEIYYSCTEKEETNIEETQETEQKLSNQSNNENSIAVKVSSGSLFTNLFKGREHLFGSESTTRRIQKSRKNETIVFPNIAQNFKMITQTTNSRIYFLLDEWSSIPLEIQPIFAEFLKRCIFCCQHLTVKIAVVPNRTRFVQRLNGSMIGIETSSELPCAIDLDQMLTVDRNYKRVLRYMTELLTKHINVLLPSRNLTIEDLSSGFQEPEVLVQLVRASEGNARDFLNILSKCLSELDYNYMSERKITYFGVAQASREWFNYDKYETLSQPQKEHFEALFSFIVLNHQTRGAFIDERALTDPFISDLIDARVLHLVSQGHTSKFPSKGQRLALIILDYGSYAEQLEHGECLDLFLDDPMEKLCRFPGTCKNLERNWWPYDSRSVIACAIDIFEGDVFKSFFTPE